MSKRIKVVLRTRPISQFASDLIQIDREKQSVHIHISKNEDWGYINNQNENWDFKFDKILHDASQEEVFEECGAEIVTKFLQGQNGTILAYGQTGSGKTFTMTGDTKDYKLRGLIPRVISNIFKEIKARDDFDFKIKLSYLEIYNEQMADLLSGKLTGNDNMAVVEEKNGGIKIKELSQRPVTSEEEALTLFFEGQTIRSLTNEPQIIKNPSRSHAIFTIYLESRSKLETSEEIFNSKLNLVDLAGSERLSRTETSKSSLKEAMSVNRSLAYLEQVIMALGDKKREHIPFRLSKMTHVLRDSLGGNCNTFMIANIRPEREHLEETVSTLRFSTRMMAVSVSPAINVKYDPAALVKRYERELKEMKQELSKYDAIASRLPHEPYPEIEKAELMVKLKLYLEKDGEELDFVNIRQAKETLSLFKGMYKTLEAELKAKPTKNENSDSKGTDSRPVTSAKGLKTASNEMKEEFSESDGKTSSTKQQGSNGKKPAASLKKKPSTDIVESSAKLEEAITTDQVAVGKILNTDVNDLLLKQEDVAKVPADSEQARPLSRAEEFEYFKKGKGLEFNKELSDIKVSTREKRREGKALAETINAIKFKIDVINAKLDERKVFRENEGLSEDIIEETEYQDIVKLKQFKKDYKKLYGKLVPLQIEIEYGRKKTDNARQKLLTEFDIWYDINYGPARLESSQPSQKQDAPSSEQKDRLDHFQVEQLIKDDPDSLPFYNAKQKSEKALKTLLIGRKLSNKIK